MEGSVLKSVHNGIATIEFFHPKHNALPGRLLEGIANAIQMAGEEEEVKVIILQSGGERTFCAGASFDELIAIENEMQGYNFFSGFAKVINAIRICPKFVIGRVQGKAVGGGVGVAAATDYCMATRYGSIKLSELAIGIGPFVVGPAVERKIGKAAFTQLAINAYEWKSAHWAQNCGLYTEVFEHLADLDRAVQELAEKLAAANPEAMSLLKKNFWAGTEHWDELLAERASMSGRLVLSEFTSKALQAFKAKNES